jgi:uncharacterized protein (TIGR00255 family)
LSLEEEIRKLLREKVSRGRIDLFITRSLTKGQERKLELDEDLLSQYLSSIKHAKKKFNLAGEIDVSLLSEMPDLFRVREIETDGVGERQALFIALKAALKQLDQSRVREGRQLKADMESQIRHLRRISVALEKQAAEVGARLQKAPVFARNGEPLPRTEKETGEPTSLVVKGDINEELVRLKSHVAALGSVVRERGPVGKKIDFILQEVQRELNTISSKAPQLPIVQLVLEGKERVEKIREQAQNIE